MATLASSAPSAGEDWLDADFDLPEGEPIHASDVDSEKEDGEDWDVEMDLGKTGGAKVQTCTASLDLKGMLAQPSLLGQVTRLHTIRPPLQPVSNEEEDEGVSTIKGLVLPHMTNPPPPASTSSCDADEDFEDGFALPTELTRLSLRPLELNHRSSKSSMEWGDKDHTTSSQSSDAYSTFGFADHSPPSTVYTSASLPDTEEEDEDVSDDFLEGLVVPSGLFESGQSVKKLTKLLETKKKTAFTDMRVKVACPDPEDDFESGLVLDDDIELSPSRLLQNTQQAAKTPTAPPVVRSKSVPPQSSALRPPSRVKTDRAKSPHHPPISSANQLRKLNAPPSPPRPSSASRSQTCSQASGSSHTPSATNHFLTAKIGGLRVQKSHSGLKPVSPPPVRQLSRKASLPSLSDKKVAQGPSSGTPLNVPAASYNAATASSRAKKHGSSTSRLHAPDYNVPLSRPTTPSNSAALRLTMPTSSSRLRSRTPVSTVFNVNPPPLPRPASPLTAPAPVPTRPPSTLSNKSSSIKSRHAQTQSLPGVPAPKVLKRPKRQRTYGDGTELDDFEDLPLDRDKEGRFRVQPKPGNRVPSVGYTPPAKPEPQPDAVPTRRLTRNGSTITSGSGSKPMPPPAKTLKRASRMEFPPVLGVDPELLGRRKKLANSPLTASTRRKPTLIRNLGGFGSARVVGEMRWNPQTLRWEGNDQVLRDFDATVGTSTRPALITNLTGSSMGSPVNTFAAGARKVGNMMFDPSRMCWISMLPPEEEEPDCFANLADDEGSDDWDSKGDTIRANPLLHKGSIAPATPCGPPCSRTRSRSESESDRCSRGSMVCDIEEGFLELCRAAEQRHRQEMRGWAVPQASQQSDRSFLYEIRALATRQY